MSKLPRLIRLAMEKQADEDLLGTLGPIMEGREYEFGEGFASPISSLKEECKLYDFFFIHLETLRFLYRVLPPME